jgi:hypothetical protein
MSMSFYGVTDEHGAIPENLEVNLSNTNVAFVLDALGYGVTAGYFEADIDEFIGTLLVADTSRDGDREREYLADKIRRLFALATYLKAEGAKTIYAA